MSLLIYKVLIGKKEATSDDTLFSLITQGRVSARAD